MLGFGVPPVGVFPSRAFCRDAGDSDSTAGLGHPNLDPPLDPPVECQGCHTGSQEELCSRIKIKYQGIKVLLESDLAANWFFLSLHSSSFGVKQPNPSPSLGIPK